MPRSKEEWKTWGDVFDQFAERTVQQLMSQGYLDGLVSPIKVGKEANIFIGMKGDGHVIVKMYRLSTCDFNRMYEYMKGDPRFGRLVKQKRKVVFAWTQREFRNLLIAHEAGVRVPVPHAARNNVLVMDMIGAPAQQLNFQPPKNPRKFFEEVIRMMRKLHQARLVHADLSDYNILNDNEKPVFIDMSAGTTYDNPNAKEYFERDVKNMARIMTKMGYPMTAEKLRARIVNG
jgi:RIO kinase 1